MSPFPYFQREQQQQNLSCLPSSLPPAHGETSAIERKDTVKKTLSAPREDPVEHDAQHEETDKAQIPPRDQEEKSEEVSSNAGEKRKLEQQQEENARPNKKQPPQKEWPTPPAVTYSKELPDDVSTGHNNFCLYQWLLPCCGECCFYAVVFTATRQFLHLRGDCYIYAVILKKSGRFFFHAVTCAFTR